MKLILMLTIATLMSGCAGGGDPYRQPYTWSPTGSNAANLAAMVDHPADLARGRGLADSDGLEAAVAVSRLRDGKVKHLIDTSGASSLGGGASGGSSTN